MKKIALLLVVLFTISSCTVGSDGPDYTMEVLPVESYEMPDSMGFGRTYDITLRYKKPTHCHTYEGLYYSREGSDRIVGISASKSSENNCLPDENEYEVSFNFKCTEHGSYRFRFYKGDDADGNPIFEDVTVNVTY